VPTYTYKCSACKEEFEVSHSIKDLLVDCTKCDVSDSLIRVPSLPLTLKRTSNNGKTSKTGSVVNKYITDAKEELEREKEELSNKEY
jgi:putative FmdB family regulatory protein